MKFKLVFDLPADNLEKPLADCKFNPFNPNLVVIDRSPAFKDAKQSLFDLPSKHARVLEPMDISSRGGVSSSSNFNEGGGGVFRPAAAGGGGGREWIGRQHSAGKSDTGYEGLANEGATCYLNSLLQTLYDLILVRKLDSHNLFTFLRNFLENFISNALGL
jgi:hypothetical protein